MQRRVHRPSPSKTFPMVDVKSMFSKWFQLLSNISRRLPITFPFLVGVWLGFMLSSGSSSYKSVVSLLDEPPERFVETSRLAVPTNRIDLPVQLFNQYLQEYATKIDGWFSREVLYVVWVVAQYQYDHLHLAGSIGEIGVHHGKYTCFLYLMRRYREQKLFAVDVFDNQALNKDGSGRGQLEFFLNNVRKYSDLHRNELSLYAGSSADLNPTFSTNRSALQWWKNEAVGPRGLQLVSVDFLPS